jgi:hypothetical protein
MSIMTADKTTRKSWQEMVASEYRRWLLEGGHAKPKKLQVAAFDRIADKWASEFAI